MAYRDVVLADSPVGYWRLGETSGNAANEVTGNAGTLAGTTPPTQGVTGLLVGDGNTAYSFPGTSAAAAKVNIAYYAAINILSDFTLEIWAQPSSVSGPKAVIARALSASTLTQMQYGLEIDASNHWSGMVGIAGARYDVANTSVTPSTTTPTHLVLRRIGTTLSLFVNNVKTDLTIPSGNQQGSTSWVMAIGAWGGSTSTTRFFPGILDEAAIYSGGLSDARIEAHYHAGIGLATIERTVAQSAKVSVTDQSRTVGQAVDIGLIGLRTVGQVARIRETFPRDVAQFGRVSLPGGVNTAIESVILAIEPTAYWRLGETGEVTIANDATGHGYVGTINGPALGPDGIPGGGDDGAMSFDGINDEVTFANNAVFNPTTDDFSVVAWARPSSATAGTNQTVVGKAAGASGGNRQWRIAVNSSNQWRAAVYASATTYQMVGPAVASTTEYTFVALIRQGTNLWVRVNDTTYGPTTIPASLNTTTAPVRIGGFYAGEYFQGDIDEVAFFAGVALTDTHLDDIYASGTTDPAISDFRTVSQAARISGAASFFRVLGQTASIRKPPQLIGIISRVETRTAAEQLEPTLTGGATPTLDRWVFPTAGSVAAAIATGAGGVETWEAGQTIHAIGDLHIGTPAAAPGRRDILVADSTLNLNHRIAQRVFVGDITNDNTTAQIADATTFLDSFAFTRYLCIGNHDLRNSGTMAGFAAAYGQPENWYEDIGTNIRIVGLHDSIFSDTIETSTDQQDFLAARAAETTRNVLVFAHAPFYDTVQDDPDITGDHNSRESARYIRPWPGMRDLVDAHPNIRLWASGHTHSTLTAPQLIMNYPLPSGGHVAMVNVSSIGYPGKQTETSSTPISTCLFTAYDGHIEVRVRDHRTGGWHMVNGVTVNAFAYDR